MSNPMDSYNAQLAETQRAVLQRMENNRVRAQQQEIQKTQDDSQSEQERLRELDEIEAQVRARSERTYDPLRVEKALQVEPFYPLIKDAVYKCIAYGVPPRMIPPFTTNPAYFSKAGDNVTGVYDAPSRSVQINLDAPAWKGKEKRPITGWDSTVGVAHDVVHEIGHALHHANVGAAWTRPFTPDAKFQEIAGKVSKYAMASNREFCAEVFCGLVAGQQYDSETMALYRRLGGWERSSSVQKGETPSPVPIHVDVHVQVPPQPAPVINIQIPEQPAPQVIVNPNITVEQKPVVETFEVFRDRAGNMTGGRKVVTPQE